MPYRWSASAVGQRREYGNRGCLNRAATNGEQFLDERQVSLDVAGCHLINALRDFFAIPVALCEGCGRCKRIVRCLSRPLHWISMRYFRLSLLYPMLLLALAQDAALAQRLPEQIGHLTRLSGSASFEWRGRSDVAHLGQAVVVGMRLRTGADGALAIVLGDGTLLALGPHSDLTLADYRFDPAKQQFRLDAELARGTLSFTSGAMSRLDPEAVTLTTPDGSIRVRDAQLLLKVGP